MTSWVAWVTVYTVMGFLLGELYILGMRRRNEKSSGLTYAIGASLWPATLIIAIFIIFKRSKT